MFLLERNANSPNAFPHQDSQMLKYKLGFRKLEFGAFQSPEVTFSEDWISAFHQGLVSLCRIDSSSCHNWLKKKNQR